jgi:hypothetical protein
MQEMSSDVSFKCGFHFSAKVAFIKLQNAVNVLTGTYVPYTVGFTARQKSILLATKNPRNEFTQNKLCVSQSAEVVFSDRENVGNELTGT